MATLSTEVSPSKPPFNRRRKSWARKIERFLCVTLSYFPLSFVLGLSTWAIWVEVNVSFLNGGSLIAYLKAALAAVLYGLAVTSYLIAVFTNPGSPLDPRSDHSKKSRGKKGDGGAYSELPTFEQDYDDQPSNSLPSHGPMTSVTAKSTGEPRYCKKCQCINPIARITAAHANAVCSKWTTTVLGWRRVSVCAITSLFSYFWSTQAFSVGFVSA